MAGIDCDTLRLPPYVGIKGKLYDSCVATNKSIGEDEHGNAIPGATSQPSGQSILGIPLPGSPWLRHMMFRAGEVIIGIAMIIVGVKALVNSSDTTKVIVQGAKKVGKQI